MKYFVKYLAEQTVGGRQLLQEQGRSIQVEKTTIITLTKDQIEDIGSISPIISATTGDKVLAILDMSKL